VDAIKRKQALGKKLTEEEQQIFDESE